MPRLQEQLIRRSLEPFPLQRRECVSQHLLQQCAVNILAVVTVGHNQHPASWLRKAHHIMPPSQIIVPFLEKSFSIRRKQKSPPKPIAKPNRVIRRRGLRRQRRKLGLFENSNLWTEHLFSNLRIRNLSVQHRQCERRIIAQRCLHPARLWFVSPALAICLAGHTRSHSRH